ncbi:DUF1240 domain-containing protein [Morganella morganii]|uniref:DUF1240 domain-containing protein n=1 Tax=Morganella morganii TaxID=582 RepID=UPI003EC06EE6
MPRWGKVIVSVLIFIIAIAISTLVYDYIISLFKMRDVIVFSGPIAILSLGMPFLLYVFFAGMIEFSFGQKSFFFTLLMKYNKLIIRGLLYLSIIGLFISFPVSFAVNIYLLDNGYKTCEKISWMSPTTYVKDLSLCGR